MPAKSQFASKCPHGLPDMSGKRVIPTSATAAT